MSEKIEIKWDEAADAKYKRMVDLIPLFHRDICKQVVDKKSVENAVDRKSKVVEEEDILKAFFSEVPMAFYSLMIRLFDEVGFDYKKYEKK